MLAIIATVAIWFGVMQLRSIPDGWAGPCDATHSFASCELHDPYCIVDPVCMSPFYKPTWTNADADLQSMPHWQGLVWLGESGTYGTGLRMLAIPNYLIFMVLLCAMVLFVQRRVSRPQLRHVLLAAVTAWLTLEILRWFATISNDDPTVPFFNWELLGVLILSLSLLAGTVITGSRFVVPGGAGNHLS